MKNSTYIEMDQAINKPYISYKEVMILGMCGENRARQIMKEINDDCEKKRLSDIQTEADAGMYRFGAREIKP